MSREEYDLMRLQIEHLEMYPYDFDPEVMNVDDFKWRNIQSNLQAYLKEQQDEIEPDEKVIIDKMIALIRTIEFDTFEDTEEYKNTLALLKQTYEDFNVKDYTELALLTLVYEIHKRLKQAYEELS